MNPAVGSAILHAALVIGVILVGATSSSLSAFRGTRWAVGVGHSSVT